MAARYRAFYLGKRRLRFAADHVLAHHGQGQVAAIAIRPIFHYECSPKFLIIRGLASRWRFDRIGHDPGSRPGFNRIARQFQFKRERDGD